MRDTYTTKKSGIELKLKPVAKLALHNILYRMGISFTPGGPSPFEQFGAKTDTEKTKALETFGQLFGYCITQGIETDAPKSAVEELEASGFPVDNPNIARLHWLRGIELDDQEEAGKLIGLIMALTFAPTVEQKEEVQEAMED